MDFVYKLISLGTHPGESLSPLTPRNSLLRCEGGNCSWHPHFPEGTPEAPRKVNHVFCMTQEVSGWDGPWILSSDFIPTPEPRGAWGLQQHDS